jgi:hypothetical protein
MSDDEAGTPPAEEAVAPQENRVRVIIAFGNFKVGAIIDTNGTYRGALLRYGWVKPLEPPEYADEQIKAAPADRMLRAKRR